MLIKINGKEMNVAEVYNSRMLLMNLMLHTLPGSIICLIKGKKELEKNVSKSLELKQHKDLLF